PTVSRAAAGPARNEPSASAATITPSVVACDWLRARPLERAGGRAFPFRLNLAIQFMAGTPPSRVSGKQQARRSRTVVTTNWNAADVSIGSSGKRTLTVPVEGPGDPDWGRLFNNAAKVRAEEFGWLTAGVATSLRGEILVMGVAEGSHDGLI